ncbi:hypothetical protein KC331_g4869 [Hortaea werneckii]|nr:hypothetical protein KC331_g4869 [Hortaea werneckii]KAI7722301.1 hypothetical protein KC353_g613 [Hortaea werneckii]
MAPPPTPVTLPSKPRDSSKETPANSAPKGAVPMTPASPTPRHGSSSSHDLLRPGFANPPQGVIPVKRAAGEQSHPRGRRQRQEHSDVRQGSPVAFRPAGPSRDVKKPSRDPFENRLTKGLKRPFPQLFPEGGKIQATAPFADAPLPVVDVGPVVDVPVSALAQTVAIGPVDPPRDVKKPPRDPFENRLTKGLKRPFAHVFQDEGQAHAKAPAADVPVPVIDAPVSAPTKTEAHDSLAVSPSRSKSSPKPADDSVDSHTGPVDKIEEVLREDAPGSPGNGLDDGYNSLLSEIGAASPPPSDDAGTGDVAEDESEDLTSAEEDTVVDLTIDEPAAPSDPAYKRKVNMSTANKVEFARHIARLEDEKAAGKNIFAAPLLEIAALFSKADAEREEVSKDPNLSDPTRHGHRFPEIRGDCQMQSMTVNDWFKLEPREDGTESWLDEGMIANIVAANLDGTVPKGYFATPDVLYSWLGTHLSPTEQRNLLVDCVQRWKESRTMPDAVPNELPLINLPSSAPFVVMPYNTGGHWITVKLEPNKETRIGKIIFYDSLDADSVTKKVRSNMPIFAELVGLRPDLEWDQESWKVEARACTIQHNSYDCGPLTAENCHRLLCGQPPIVRGTKDAAHKYGITLRYEALCKLFLLLMGRPFSQQSGTAKEIIGRKLSEALAPSSPSAASESRDNPTPGESDDGESEAESSSSADGEGEDESSPQEDEQSEYEASSLENEDGEEDLALEDDDSLCADDEKKSGAEVLNEIALEDDDNPIVVDEIQSDGKLVKVNEPEGGDNLFVDDESEFEDDFGEADETIASTSSGIRERLCDALEESGPMTISDLASKVEENLPNEVATAPDFHRLLERLLERSAFIFRWEWEEPELESKLYWVHPGPGRSLSTHSRRRLFTVDDVNLEGTETPNQNQWDVAVAIVRTSRRHQALDSKLAYVQRCEELLRRAIACSEAPGRQIAKYDSEAAMPDYPFWAPYFREDISSTKELLQGPRRRDQNFRKLLGDLNTKAEASRHPVRVCLMGNGWDGISTANDGWNAIVEAYPFLVLSISLAFNVQVAPAGVFQQGENNTLWAHYSLSMLGKVWQMSLPPKQLWTRSQVHHEQFLYICQAINAAKVDSSLAGYDRRFRTFPSNKLARRLTKVRRNTFKLDEASSSDGAIEWRCA